MPGDGDGEKEEAIVRGKQVSWKRHLNNTLMSQFKPVRAARFERIWQVCQICQYIHCRPVKRSVRYSTGS